MNNEPTEQRSHPSDRFVARIAANEKLLFNAARTLARIDPRQDLRPNFAELSRTHFWPHSLFSNEHTSLIASHGDEESPRFSIRTSITLSNAFTSQDHKGFLSKEKVLSITSELQEELTDYEVLESIQDGLGGITITGEGAMIGIALGYTNFETNESVMRENAEIVKEIVHPEGIYYEEFNSSLAALITDSIGPEAEDSRTRVQSQARETLLSAPPDFSENNEDIFLYLYGLPSDDPYELIAGITNGAHLTSAELFKKQLTLYAYTYSALINAMCTIEQTFPPAPEVELGSNLV